MKLTERISWIDDLRLTAILFMILGHTISSLNVDNRHEFILWIVSFNMPLFVFISGYSSCNGIFREYTFKSLLEKIFNSAKKLLIPSAFMGHLTSSIFSLVSFDYNKFFIHIAAVLFVWAIFILKEKSNIDKKVVIALQIICILLGYYSFQWFFSMLFVVTTVVTLTFFICKGKFLLSSVLAIFMIPVLWLVGGMKMSDEFNLFLYLVCLLKSLICWQL